MALIQENLERIRRKIKAAAERAGRDPEQVRLVAVCKRMPLERIEEAVAAGQTLFGESFVLEAREKILELGSKLTFHFIGHLQSNKAKVAADIFSVIETIDRLKLAKALDQHLAGQQRTLAGLLQVNIGREPQKSGVMPEDVVSVLAAIKAECPRLEMQGLMAIPPYQEDPEAVRPFFAEMRRLAEDCAAKGLIGADNRFELSMGMSHDFEVAIEEGATLVRVGTAIFGSRV